MAHRLPEESLRTMLFVAAQETVSLIGKTEAFGPEPPPKTKSRFEDVSRDTAKWWMNHDPNQNSTLSPHQIKSSEYIWINIHWGLNRCQAPWRGLQSGKTGYKQEVPLSSGAPGPKADFSIPSRGWGFLVLQIHRVHPQSCWDLRSGVASGPTLLPTTCS